MNRIDYNVEGGFITYPWRLSDQHWAAVCSCEWDGRLIVHLVLGFLEVIPLVGYIVSLFDRAWGVTPSHQPVGLDEMREITPSPPFLVREVGESPILVEEPDSDK